MDTASTDRLDRIQLRHHNFAGNLTDQPELRHTDSGIARAMFQVAVSGRREQEPSFFTVIVWRDQAEMQPSRSPKAAGSWS